MRAKLRELIGNVLLWVRSKPTQNRYIFVTGAPRSGTSLLKNLLVTHSKLCGSDRESTGIFRLRNFFEFSIGEIPKEKISEIVLSSANIPVLYNNITSELLVRKGGELFVDKINVKGWRLRYLLKYFPRAKYVNIIRDGRDAYCSAVNHPNVRQSKNVEHFASYWKKCIELPCELIPAENIHTVYYEDLVKDPVTELTTIMNFHCCPVNFHQKDI